MLALAVLLSDPIAVSLVALQLHLTASSRTVSLGSRHSQLFHELGGPLIDISTVSHKRRVIN